MPTRLVALVALVLLVPVAADSKPERQRFAFTHVMEYDYDRPVTLAHHSVRLLPQAGMPGRVTDHDFAVECSATPTVRRQLDPENNLVAGVTFAGATKRLVVKNRFVLDIPASEPAFDLRPDPAAFPIVYPPEDRKRLALYLEAAANPGPKLTQFLAALPKDHASCTDWLADTGKRIADKVPYFTRREEGVQLPETTLERGGTCRDFAWLSVQALRSKGVAARFVSGYQIPKEALAARDAKAYPAELHAWVEVYLPGPGWVGFDPTAGKWATAAYVPVARAATPWDAGSLQGTFAVAPPMPGVFAKSTLKFTISVTRLDPPKP